MSSLSQPVSSSAWRIGAAIVGAILFYGGISISANNGFKEVLSFRLLERIPPTYVIGSVTGEIQLKGYARATDGRYLRSPVTRNEVLYYRHVVEVKRKNSQGDDYWAITTDSENMLDFHVEDQSGKALVLARSDFPYVNFRVERKHYDETSRRRISEYRIDKNDTITVFGWVIMSDTVPVVSFSAPGAYEPIISSFAAEELRGDLGATAILWLWAGVSCFVFLSYCIFFVMRWHQTIRFLLVLSISVTSLLAYYGFQSLESDLTAGMDRVEQQVFRTDKFLSEFFSRKGIESGNAQLAAGYQGLGVPFDLHDPAYEVLTPFEKTRINTLRISAYQVRYRYTEQIGRFPENIYAALRGLNDPPVVALPPDQQETADNWADDFVYTRTEGSAWLTLGALILVLVFLRFSVRLIKVKRMQENLPSAKASGVTYGMTELKGKVRAENDEKLLIAPHSKRPCIWYLYTILEKDGDSTKATHFTKRQAFYCADREGEIRVFPNKATIYTKHVTVDQRSDFKRVIEKRIEVGDDIYILGMAQPDRTRGDSLVITHQKELPFIITNRSEEEVMVINAAMGVFLMSIGISLLFLVMLWIGGAGGSISSLDFVLLAGLGPFLLLSQVVILMYNDLVFLRERCDRDWANIQVSLKKRYTLVPRLQQVVRAYLDHEARLLKLLSRMRRRSVEIEDTGKLDDYMKLEHDTIDSLQVAVEDYPDLKGDEQVADLSRRLIRLENEIAMIRAGFNDAVMLYNIRIATFPDILLAKLFKFEEKSLLRYSESAHAVEHSG